MRFLMQIGLVGALVLSLVWVPPSVGEPQAKQEGMAASMPIDPQDFSDVDSIEKARALVAEGRLVPMYLMPLEFGGPDVHFNIVFVPREIAEIKSRTDRNVIRPLAESGRARDYSATPTYAGQSIVPTKVQIRAGEFSMALEVWGGGPSK